MNDEKGDLTKQSDQPADQNLADNPNNAFDNAPDNGAADAQLQPSVEDIEPEDPVDILDSEPETRPTEPNLQPFADKPPLTDTPIPAQPSLDDEPSVSDSASVEPVTPEAAVPAAAAGLAPSQIAAQKYKQSKPGKSPKAAKAPKAAKPPKAPKQPKNRSGKSPAKKIIITLLISLILLVGIAAALWFFVFQPKETYTNNTTDQQQSAKPVERTIENSAQLAIEAIQAGLHTDLDDLYEEMVITPSTPDSSDAILSPSYQVSGEDFSVSTTETYGLVVAPNQSQAKTSDNDADTAQPTAIVDPNFVEQVELTSTTILINNGYTEKQNDARFGTIYESADVVCSVMTDSMPNQVLCVNKSAYRTASDQVKPFATAFLADNQQPNVEASFKNNIDVQASATENYEIAEVGMINAVGLFYRQLGQDWSFFTGTQQILACSAFDTAPVQAAFAGEKCLDASVDNPTNKPTTVAEYFAKDS